MAQIPSELQIVTLALRQIEHTLQRMEDVHARMNTIEPTAAWKEVTEAGYLAQVEDYRKALCDWTSALMQLWRIYGTNTT